MNMVEAYIGRIVTFVVTPIALPVVAGLTIWANDNLGLDLEGNDLTALVVAVVAGLAIQIYKWLSNRGEWEVAQKYAETAIANAWVEPAVITAPDTKPTPISPTPPKEA